MTPFQRPQPGPLPRRRAVVDHLRRIEPRRVLSRLTIGIVLLTLLDVGLEWRATVAGLGTTTSVATVARDTPAGTEIGPEDVRIVQWPAALVPTGAVTTSPGGAVARADLVAGEVLVAHRLYPSAAGTGADDRLVTLPIPSAPPPVRAGSRVELYGIRVVGDAVATPATRLTVGVVIEITDAAIAVAVPETAVPIVLEHLAFGVVDVIAFP